MTERFLASALNLVFLLSSLFLLSGCATEAPKELSSPKFSEAVDPAAGRALVYMFRPGFTPFRGADKPNIYIDGRLRFPLLWKGYFPLTLEPGEHLVEIKADSHASSDWNMVFKINPVAGETYFLAIWNMASGQEVSMIMPVGAANFFIPITAVGYRDSGTKYELVRKEDAVPVLKDCHLIPDLY